MSDMAAQQGGVVAQDAVGALTVWGGMAKGAYSKNTLRAQKADGAIFQSLGELKQTTLKSHRISLNSIVDKGLCDF